MADEAATTIADLPPKPTQERLLGAFMDQYHDFLIGEVEDLFANHNYLDHTQKFDNLARDLEVKAKTDGWNPTKTLIYAAVGNTMAKEMLDAGHDLVLGYPIAVLPQEPAPLASDDPPPAPPAAAATDQAGTAGQQAQTEKATDGAIPAPGAAAGVALPNTGAGAPAPQEGATAAS